MKATSPALALPAWLPAHVPPVAPQLNADPLPARWPLQRPLAWRIDVAGGYSEDDLQALLDLQLRDSPALGVYPPLIEAIRRERGNGEQLNSISPVIHGQHRSVRATDAA